MSKLIINIIGAQRGQFTNDEKQTQDYANCYATENLRPDEARKLDACGVSVIKYTLEPAAFAAIKAQKLPCEFICEVQTSQNANGLKQRLLTATKLPA